MTTHEDLAKRIDVSLLSAALTEDAVRHACKQSATLGLACCIVRPTDVEIAVRAAGPSLRVGSVVDYPYGFSTTSAKLYAARDLLRRGAREIETPMSLGKLLDRQFQYLESELQQMAQACHESGAALKVTIDSSALDDELLLLCCRILRRAEVDFLSNSTLDRLELLKTHSRDRLQIKISAPFGDLDATLAACERGVARLEAADPAALLGAWNQLLAARAKENAAALNA